MADQLGSCLTCIVAVVVFQVIFIRCQCYISIRFTFIISPTPQLAKVIASCFSCPRDAAMKISTLRPLISGFSSLTIMCTRLESSRRVHPKSKPHTMELISHMFHAVGKLGTVGKKGTILCPTCRPAIVQYHIVVSKIAKAIIDNLLCCSQ